MTSAGRRIGALSGYWSHARRLTEDEVTVVEIIARHAAHALSTAWDEAQLGVALSGRKLIGRAEGVLMERYCVDADRAYEVLRRFSQDHHIKLRDVAAHLIHTRELPTTDSST